MSIPKTNPTINPGINPIDNVNTSSIKNLIYVNIANAAEYRLGKDPCKELERDMKAAEKRAKNGNSDSAKREARKANTNMQEAYNKCCLKVGGGDGGGGDLLPKDSGKTPVPTVTIPLPDITVPIDEPPSDTKPPEYTYVCDFTSPSFNHMYNCIVKQGDYTIDDIQCNPSENKSFKDYQSVTKKFLGLIPYTTIEEKELFYNPVCVKPPEVPPIDEPP
ncbi:MAG: hypothetical protein PHP14_01870, partial [Candidatus Pacebacteria bacterium]|nr:hypothetical protein [Candidatus Paceibacterota bacterium]